MREKIIRKNEIDRNYILFGKKNSESIDQNKPITLICNNKIYPDRVFNKQHHIIYANKEFFKEQMIGLGDRLIFDTDGISNTIRITILKQAKNVNNSNAKEKFLELIDELKSNFLENEWCFRASEENVRVELIDPILKALGWKMPYLRREEHGKDYLLSSEKFINKESVRIVIEAKKYREQLISRQQSNDYKNMLQLFNYCETTFADCEMTNSTIIGILTNGIRWIKFEYQKDYTCLSFVSEINLIDDHEDDVYTFFKSISFDEVKGKTTFDNEIRPYPNKETSPSIIRIDKEPFDTQGEANYHVAEKLIEYCKTHNLNPLDFKFKNIIISKTIVKGRTCKPYDSYYLIGDYGIYVKTTLLQEINSTVGLNLDIVIE